MISRSYVIQPQAAEDLDEIWEYIAATSIEAADRVLDQLYGACRLLAQDPHIGHTREDITEAPVKFWTVYSYLIVYEPDSSPLSIIAVLHGARDVGALLKGR